MKNHGYKSRHGFTFYDPVQKERRRKEATQRNRDWQSLSLLEQLDNLDKRFGVGQGATKQRAKIKALISAGATHPKVDKKK